MTKEAKAIQDLLDPTTGAQVAQQYSFPMAVRTEISDYLVIDLHTELCISRWPSYTGSIKAIGIDRVESNSGTEIPAADLIAELEQLISEMKSKL